MKKAIFVTATVFALASCSGTSPLQSISGAVSNARASLFGGSGEAKLNLPDPNPELTIASQRRSSTMVDGQQFEVTVEALRSIAFVRPIGTRGAYSAKQVEMAVQSATGCRGIFDKEFLGSMGGTAQNLKNLAPFGIGRSNDYRNWRVRVAC